MAAVLLLLLFLLLRLLGERLLCFRILVKIEVECFDVVQLIADAGTDRNHARSLTIAHVNLILSSAFTAFVKGATLVSFDLNIITPCACPSFHLADILVLFEFERLATYSFRHRFDSMRTYSTRMTLVVELYAVNERPLGINIDAAHSWKIITKGPFQLHHNIIVHVSGAFMDWSTDCRLDDVGVPGILLFLFLLLLWFMLRLWNILFFCSRLMRLRTF